MPSVSIVILLWNSRPTLAQCLDSLARQSFNDFEVILVDNGSTDNPLEGLDMHGLQVRLEPLTENKGFAVANNLGARLARGKWLILLNADAYPEPDWLEKIVHAGEKHPRYAAFTSRQLQANTPKRLDGAGDAYHISGLAWRRYYNLPAEQVGRQIGEVFSACGAAAMYLREAFLQAGGFDEDYFSYFEDVDLGFRLRLSGKKCLYVPEAVVHHVGSASTGKRSDFSIYYGYRNLIWTFFKDMPSPLLWLLLPLHLGTMLFFVLYLTLRGQGQTIWRAIIHALRGIPNILAKRKLIQQNRRSTSAELLKAMSTNLLEPYLEFARRNKAK